MTKKTIDRVVRLAYRLLAVAVAAAGVLSIEEPRARWVAVVLVSVAVTVAIFDGLLDLAHEHGQLTDVTDVTPLAGVAIPGSVAHAISEAKSVDAVVAAAEKAGPVSAPAAVPTAALPVPIPLPAAPAAIALPPAPSAPQAPAPAVTPPA